MTSSTLSVILPIALALSPAAPPSSRADAAAEALRAAERDALRVLAALAAGEPGIGEVQEAAAVAADRSVGEARGFARRARIAALLPRFTAEVRREDRSQRVVGLQGSGEVDYVRLLPGTTFIFRATWELGELVAARGELSAAAIEGDRARRRSEAVKRATALFYQRREAQLALRVAPPEGVLPRAEAELELDRLGAELDAITGGLLSGRRR